MSQHQTNNDDYVQLMNAWINQIPIDSSVKMKPDHEITDASSSSPVTPSVPVTRAQVLETITRLEDTGELDVEVAIALKEQFHEKWFPPFHSPNSGASNAALDGPHTSIRPPLPNDTTNRCPYLEPEPYTLEELQDWMKEIPVFAVYDEERMPDWMVEALEGLGVLDSPHDEEET
jgi:hypothetical protein